MSCWKAIVIIANDITHKAGSFGTVEDKLFSAATEYAELGIPRIYLAANSVLELVWLKLKKHIKLPG